MADIKKVHIEAEDFSSFLTEGWYCVNLGPLSLDFYFKPSEFKQTYVFSPGWIDRKKFGNPYFQRLSWFSSLQGICISLSDPTLNLAEEIQVGWFLGDENNDHMQIVATYLQRLLDHLGVRAKDVLFFGSSAGGYSSVGMAAYFRGSRALAINPQTDLLKFHNICELAKILRIGFRSRNSTALLEEIPWRFSLVALFAKLNYIPSFQIIINTADAWHMDQHIIPLLGALKIIENGNKIDAHFYYDQALGHNPPGPGFCIPVIKGYMNGIKPIV